jgi:hypothetical protein
MKGKLIPNTFQRKISDHCQEIWTNRAGVDTAELFEVRKNASFLACASHFTVKMPSHFTKTGSGQT